jgi:hypothetical protein
MLSKKSVLGVTARLPLAILTGRERCSHTVRILRHGTPCYFLPVSSRRRWEQLEEKGSN